jgi:hypothetical protein
MIISWGSKRPLSLINEVSLTDDEEEGDDDDNDDDDDDNIEVIWSENVTDYSLENGVSIPDWGKHFLFLHHVQTSSSAYPVTGEYLNGVKVIWSVNLTIHLFCTANLYPIKVRSMFCIPSYKVYFSIM